MDRKYFEDEYGKENVWNTEEVQKAFEITSFLAPCCFATRRSDFVKGTLMFQDQPRFYFGFVER